jgi:hypothetical protein
MPKELGVGELPVPSPIPEFAVADVQSDFGKISKESPRDTGAEQAFIASKIHANYSWAVNS